MPYVAAFYLDEPLWNLFNAGWNTADSLAIVQAVGEVLKGQSALCSGGTTYPQDAAIPFAVVEAYLTAPIQQPPAVDWVGFDCYGPFEDCSGPVGGGNAMAGPLHQSARCLAAASKARRGAFGPACS